MRLFSRKVNEHLSAFDRLVDAEAIHALFAGPADKASQAETLSLLDARAVHTDVRVARTSCSSVQRIVWNDSCESEADAIRKWKARNGK